MMMDMVNPSVKRFMSEDHRAVTENEMVPIHRSIDLRAPAGFQFGNELFLDGN
jgi:hypothetical protein